MADSLTGPFAVAAIVLSTAGFAKLRAPATATRALASAGLPAAQSLVRAFGASEVALGGWCLAHPGRLNAALLGVLYAWFAVLSLVLARRRAACGCFGERDAPASGAQAIVSVALALVALTATIRTPHGLAWIVNRPVPSAAILLLGIASAAYGTILAYVELPQAWYPWSPR